MYAYEALAALIGLGIGTVTSSLAWWGKLHKLKHGKIPECRHEVWTPWEDCEVEMTWGPRTDRHTERYPGQRRECLGCGFKQRQRILVGDK